MLRKLAEFFLLLGATILATYYLPEIAKTPFYILLLIAYFRSANEAMWLAFFLTTSDGFWGYFNSYEVVLKLIPGLPAIEVEQIYIALALIKASKRESPGALFHTGVLRIMAGYIAFLVVQGYTMGLSPELNVQFRLVKYLLPLSMFYTLPRLFRREEDFRDFFLYVFPMAFLALFAQVFTITTSLTPSQFLGVYKKFWFTVDVAKGKTYRGFYSSATVLLSYFGAFFWLSRKERHFDQRYLFAVLAACFLCVVLSATRGWLIGFSLILLMSLILVLKMSAKQTASIGLAAVLIVSGLMLIPVVEKQFTNAFLRFTTLEKLASGDATAGGTLSRITERSPRVMDKWSEAPISGWGFSDEYFKYGDFHVGNQNILLHAGIIGALLMGIFILYFHGSLLARSLQLLRGNPYKESLLVWAAFFPGWFSIHSSSGQHFAFYADPTSGIVLGVYITMGALIHKLSFNPLRKTEESPPAD
ncbi:MAG: O-antigen ligase family protein [Lewinellaceae bacterium]|nr:O-antigen ligase family protein [Lewinellaceae bacterium]